MNLVMLTGRITKDVELNTTKNNTTYTKFSVAVRRDRKEDNGEYQSDFINCVAYSKTAEYMSTYVKKGSLLGISGRITTGSYKNKNNETIYTFEILVDKVEQLSNFENKQEHQQQKKPAYSEHKEETPTYEPAPERITTPPNTFSIDDEELPF